MIIKIKLLIFLGDYITARNKSAKAQDTSDLNSTDCEKRRVKPNTIMSSSEEDDDDVHQSLKRISLPPTPTAPILPPKRMRCMCYHLLYIQRLPQMMAVLCLWAHHKLSAVVNVATRAYAFIEKASPIVNSE